MSGLETKKGRKDPTLSAVGLDTDSVAISVRKDTQNVEGLAQLLSLKKSLCDAQIKHRLIFKSFPWSVSNFAMNIRESMLRPTTVICGE